MYFPDFLDGFDWLVAFDVETTGNHHLPVDDVTAAGALSQDAEFAPV